MPVCTACGRENPDGFRFCGTCGAPLSEARAAPREERKVVTVVYADLVGSTARAERLDPEDVRAVLAPYHARLRTELERFGGTVEKFIGDAVVALFGAPVSHEDDPERAVRAGLAIQDAIAELNEATPALELEVRVGVTTGEALVALDTHPGIGEGMASGDVMNTGARLQTAAPPGGVLVGDATFRATQHVIDYEPVAPVVGKGKSEPILAWRALQPRSRLGVDVRQHGLTPLVGRRRELALVLATLDRARAERETQLVTLVGVPGIGKSRLVHETLQAVEADPELITWRQGRCLPYGDGVTFWAVGEMVKAHAGVLDTDSAAETEAKLHRVLASVEDGDRLERHLRPLVGLTVAADSGDRGAEAFAAWRHFFEAIAEEGPAVLVFEDLHWADDRLLEFVDHLADWARGVPLLVLCTARPELLERRAGWGGGKLNAATVALTPLRDEETAELAAAIAEGDLDEAAIETVLTHADGNPLYAEQYVRMLRDRGDQGAALPETVQGIIAARLDGLPAAEKELLHQAAVIGRVFWDGAIRALGHSDGETVSAALHALERKEFVRRERRSSVGGETEYAFRHALVRDVTYGQIPRAARTELHRGAAKWIEGLSERLEDFAELRAHHWLSAAEYARQAGLVTAQLEERAREALVAAAERAVALNALDAAERAYSQALLLWPEDGSLERLLVRYRRQLALAGDVRVGPDTAALRDALLAVGLDGHAAVAEIGIGWTALHEGRVEEATASRERALALVAHLPPSTEKLAVLELAARWHILGREPEAGLHRAREVLELAEVANDARARIEALNTIGVCSVLLGKDAGFDDLARAIRLSEDTGSFSVVRALMNAASLRVERGELEEGFRLQARSMRAAERFGSGYEVLWLVGERALEYWWRGQFDLALADADQVVASVEAGSPHYMEVVARWVRAMVRLARDDVPGALAESAAVVALGRMHGGQVLSPALVGRMTACTAAGELAEAHALADEVLAQPFVDWFAMPAPAFVALGRAGDLLSRPPAQNASAWEEAARARLRGENLDAASRFAEIGSLPDEAEARLRAGESLLADGRTAEGTKQLKQAVAFWRSVGATRYVQEAEALLAAAAK